MADVFLSYKREERERCVAISEALISLGLTVWFDAKLSLGIRFDKEIEHEIAVAKVVLVLWSRLSVESDWVREEAQVGRDRKCLVSARIEPCDLPMGFRAVQTADLFSLADDDEGWLQVLERIGVLLDRPGLANFVRCRALGEVTEWQQWLVENRNDPLLPEAITALADAASPDLRRRLAEENAQRIILEGQLQEYRASQEGQIGQLRASGAELARLRQSQEALARERAALEAKIAALTANAPVAVTEAIETALTEEASSAAEEIVEERREAAVPPPPPPPPPRPHPVGPAEPSRGLAAVLRDTSGRFDKLEPRKKAAVVSIGMVSAIGLIAVFWSLVGMPSGTQTLEVPADNVTYENVTYGDIAAENEASRSNAVRGEASPQDEAPAATPTPTPTPTPSPSPTPAPVDRNRVERLATGRAGSDPGSGSAGSVCTPGPYIVFFDWGSSRITPEAGGILDNVVANYASCGGAGVYIDGHLDRSEESPAVSRDRAMGVRRWLSSRGIPISRIGAISYGASRPRVQTPDGVRELQNRRVEIVFGP